MSPKFRKCFSGFPALRCSELELELQSLCGEQTTQAASSLADSQSSAFCSYTWSVYNWVYESRSCGPHSSLGSIINLFFGLSSKLHPPAQLALNSLLWKIKLTLWIQFSLDVCDHLLSAEPWRAHRHLNLTHNCREQARWEDITRQLNGEKVFWG